MNKNLNFKKLHPNGYFREDIYIVENIYPLLSQTAQKTYGYFLRHFFGFLNPTSIRKLKTIAEKTGLNEKTIRRSIIALEEKKLLKTTKREGAPTEFTLLFPWKENPDFIKEINSGIKPSSSSSWPKEDIPANFEPLEIFSNPNATQMSKNNGYYTPNQNQDYSNLNNISNNVSSSDYSPKGPSIDENYLIALLKQKTEDVERLNAELLKQKNQEIERLNIRCDQLDKDKAEITNMAKSFMAITLRILDSNDRNMPILNTSDDNSLTQKIQELFKKDNHASNSCNDNDADEATALTSDPVEAPIISKNTAENSKTVDIFVQPTPTVLAEKVDILSKAVGILPDAVDSESTHIINILNKTTTTKLESYPLEAKKEDLAQIGDWSSSSDFKNLNEIQENVDLIDIKIASRFGITQSKIRQLLLKGNHTAQEIQDSIDAYCFDLIENNKLKNIKNPCAYFMKTMLDGNSFHFPKNYISREDAEKLKLQKIEAKKEQNQIELKRELEELVRKKIDYLLKENLEEFEELELIAKEKSKQTASINIQHEAYNHLDEKGRKEMVDFMVDIGINLELEEVVREKFYSNHPAITTIKKCEFSKN